MPSGLVFLEMHVFFPPYPLPSEFLVCVGPKLFPREDYFWCRCPHEPNLSAVTLAGHLPLPTKERPTTCPPLYRASPTAQKWLEYYWPNAVAEMLWFARYGTGHRHIRAIDKLAQVRRHVQQHIYHIDTAFVLAEIALQLRNHLTHVTRFVRLCRVRC